MATTIILTPDLARKLIAEQFPEYAHLPITSVEKQGHDNRTYRLGPDMLIRMPTAESYALKVPKEQELLPQLAKYLSLSIPAPINVGQPSKDYPYPNFKGKVLESCFWTILKNAMPRIKSSPKQTKNLWGSI